MTKRLLPFLVASMCAMPLAQGPAPAVPCGSTGPAPACAAEDAVPGAALLSDAEREAFRIAQQAADPDLGDQRAGHLGAVLLAVLLILVIVAIIE
jgi:hypothetical protein